MKMGRAIYQFKTIKNQRGQSLVQVIISASIMGIMMLAVAAMMTSQRNEAKALTEKLATSDLEKVLIASLSTGTVCSYVLNNPVVLTFNSATLPATITLPSTPAQP